MKSVKSARGDAERSYQSNVSKRRLCIFTPATWEEFRRNGASVAGFNPKQWNVAGRLSVGDHLLCYVSGARRWVGITTVKSKVYRGMDDLWTDDLYPCRVNVQPKLLLSLEEGVPMLDLIEQFENQESWQGYIRRSPQLLPNSDARLIERALYNAQKKPVLRPVKITKSMNYPTWRR